MLPTIRQVLDLAIVQGAAPEVLGGTAELHRPVRWVHVSEIKDPAGMLSGGELVLTTGLELERSPAAAADYLHAVEATGAAGVMVELADPRPGVLAALRAAAVTVSMPVIALARRVRFVDITELVHRQIVAEQLELAELSRSVHEAFTQLSLESAGAQEIVARASVFIQAPVVLEDLSHLVLTHAADRYSTTDLLADWERRSRVTPATGQTGRAGPEGWLQTPVGLRRQLWGRLIVPVSLHGGPEADGGRDRDPGKAYANDPGNESASDSVAAMVLERAGQALSINRLAERDQRQLSQQAQSGLLNELRQPRALTEPEAVARAAALGLRPSPLYLPVVVRVGGAGEETRTDPLAGQRDERSLLEDVVQVLNSTGSSALIASMQAGYIAVLLSLPARALEQQLLERICDGLTAPTRIPAARKQLPAPPVPTGWTMGVGHARSELLDAAAGLDEASHVAQTASTLKEHSKPFFRAHDVRLRGLLALLRNDSRVQAFVESELAGVLRLAAHDDGAQLALLQAYLEHGGNKAAMAREGFLSRPTLYARLARLEELLAVDLDDPESRTSLHVAVMLHQLRGL
ncbi:PucR family transcriptional regulator ligand-binding domain-containing protein [Paeniglutamicibacter antarcticus]|uniref:PucR family transcriptional regulator ligand-binding domain-containing protein n=1 Tax=Arthrobacter terrae TaxID=2935737 RepID=A0A931G4A9_9MICC|nr:PucR family transcriptional regulator ligand-binding domain-containing protein [Arthrobacter terrae]MBG0738613.1 PucR family transcriptional regulator ligand-binding domain-containing protein [Arthrobacter terrae]